VLPRSGSLPTLLVNELRLSGVDNKYPVKSRAVGHPVDIQAYAEDPDAALAALDQKRQIGHVAHPAL
jgi:hypothetical protein